MSEQARTAMEHQVERNALLRLLLTNTDEDDRERWAAGSGVLRWKDPWCSFGSLSIEDVEIIRSALMRQAVDKATQVAP